MIQKFYQNLESSQDSQNSEPSLVVTSFCSKFSFKRVKFLTEILTEEIKPVVSEKFEFEEREVKIVSTFWIFQTIKNSSQGPKVIVFQWNTPLQNFCF